MAKVITPELIYERLVGGCKGDVDSEVEVLIEEEGYEPVDLTRGFYEAIYDLMFNCTGCGWWCWSHELCESDLGEWICTQCKEEYGS